VPGAHRADRDVISQAAAGLVHGAPLDLRKQLRELRARAVRVERERCSVRLVTAVLTNPSASPGNRAGGRSASRSYDQLAATFSMANREDARWTM
jgi:hypothetical protein